MDNIVPKKVTATLKIKVSKNSCSIVINNFLVDCPIKIAVFRSSTALSQLGTNQSQSLSFMNELM